MLSIGKDVCLRFHKNIFQENFIGIESSTFCFAGVMYRRILVSLIVAILCCVVFVNAQRNRKLCHQYDGICQDARWTTALGFPTCATLKAGYTCKDIHGLCRCVASHSGRWFMTGGDRQPTEEE